MRKTIALLLAAVTCILLLLTIPPAQVQAASTWEYVSYTNWCYIYKYNGSAASVTVPSTLDGKPVISIHTYTFVNSNVRSVTIPASVTEIDSRAFYDCPNLTTVTFQGDTRLANMAFNDCPKLKTVNLGSKMSTIGAGAFSGCSALTQIKLPESMRSIGSGAFAGCGLTSIILPNNLSNIGGLAFNGCPITQVNIPKGFRGTITGESFIGCPIQAYTVEEGNTSYSAVDGVLFNRSKTELIAYPRSKSGSVYYVPEGVTSIGTYAFSNTGTNQLMGGINVSTLYIPASVKTLDAYFLYTTNHMNLYFCGDRPSYQYYICGNNSKMYYAEGRENWENAFSGKTQIWPAEEHAKVKGDSYGATCGENGYTLMGCSRCDWTYKAYRSDEPATGEHVLTQDWVYADRDNHQKTCTVCNQAQTELHIGGTATCTQQAVCDACMEAYGPDPEHDFTGNAPETAGEDGHYFICSRCGIYSELMAHAGGTATCTEQAVCEDCGDAYGTAMGHQFEKGICTACGAEDPEYVLFGDLDEDGEVTDWDAILFARYLAGWNVTIDLRAADMDQDGEISDWDAILLERFLAGWDITLTSG